MQYELPKNKSLYDLEKEERIKLPASRMLYGWLPNSHIQLNMAFLTKTELKKQEIKIYGDTENIKDSCKFNGYIKTGSKNTNIKILQDIQKILDDHLGEIIDNIFHIKLFSEE